MKTIELDATIENLDEIIAFADAFLEEKGCDMKSCMKIELALEEAYVNIANYAYGDKTGKARLDVSTDGNEFTFVLSDSGVPYNPLEKEDPDVTLSAEERQIGGLGVFLVKKNMDFVSYDYKDGRNILTMKKTM